MMISRASCVLCAGGIREAPLPEAMVWNEWSGVDGLEWMVFGMRLPRVSWNTEGHGGHADKSDGGQVRGA